MTGRPKVTVAVTVVFPGTVSTDEICGAGWISLKVTDSRRTAETRERSALHSAGTHEDSVSGLLLLLSDGFARQCAVAEQGLAQSTHKDGPAVPTQRATFHARPAHVYCATTPSDVPDFSKSARIWPVVVLLSQLATVGYTLASSDSCTVSFSPMGSYSNVEIETSPDNTVRQASQLPKTADGALEETSSSK
jgi:hypothetical protein